MNAIFMPHHNGSKAHLAIIGGILSGIVSLIKLPCMHV